MPRERSDPLGRQQSHLEPKQAVLAPVSESHRYWAVKKRDDVPSSPTWNSIGRTQRGQRPR